jgi:hypothetical protein
MGQEGVVWFIALIEDVENDPLQLGRVRIRPIGSAENLDVDELHWATLIVPVTSASLKGVGISPTGLEVGSMCVGWFLDGHEKQKPIIIGTFHKIPGMDFDNHDVNPLARGEQTLEKQRVGPEPKSAFDAEYPFNKVYATKGGHVIEIDDTEGAERIHIYHKAGSYTEINQAGDRVDKTVGDKYDVIVGAGKVYVGGKLNVEVKDTCTITVHKDCTVHGKKNVTVKADKTAFIKGKKVKIN